MLQDIVAQRCKDWGGELLDCNGEANQPRSYPDVPSAEPRPVAFRQQREGDQQQIGPARVRQSASMCLSHAGVLVPVVLHHLMWGCTAVGDQAICRAAECAGVIFGPLPEAAFTSTLAIAKSGALAAVR
jgi:hypothetical protein